MIPILWGVAALFWLIAVILLGAKKIEGKRLVLIGPPAAGKTYLYCKLRGVPYSGYDETAEDEYGEFVYKKSDGSQIKIFKGIDFGGDKDYLKTIGEKIPTCDCAIMLFDIHKYVNEDGYDKKVRMRLDFICQILKNEQGSKASVSVLMTHADELKNVGEVKNAIKMFKKDIAGKEYEKMIVKGNPIPINLTDDKMFKKVIDKLL